MEFEGGPPVDCKLGDLPAVLARATGLEGNRPGEQITRPAESIAAGCGNRARRGALRERVTVPEAWWGAGVSAPAERGNEFGTEQARLETERWRGAISQG